MITIHQPKPEWPEEFAKIRDFVWPVVKDHATTIHHVGSTSVPNLPAKDIIDISIECPHQAAVNGAIAGLATLGYEHRGNLGISAREAFYEPSNMRKHNLYVCEAGGLGLRNHLAFRDYLRSHPETAAEYAELKFKLAPSSAEKYENYWFGKTEFVLSILAKCGLPEPLRDQIQAENR